MVTPAAEATTWLVGDIGGTHARFGLVSPDGKVLHSRTLADEEYPTIEAALTAFLNERGSLPMPHRGAIAIASPITGDRVAMTNHPWRFSIRELGDRFGLERFEVINDFTALALARRQDQDQRAAFEHGSCHRNQRRNGSFADLARRQNQYPLRGRAH